MMSVQSPLGTFHKRSDLHVARKLWHMITVGIMAYVYINVPTQTSAWILGSACAVFIPIDFIRQKNPKLNARLVKWFSLFIRENEINRLAGTTFLMIGVATTMIFFDQKIVLLSLLFLGFADPLASFVGIKYGRDKIIGEKSLEGALASFAVCSIITFLFCLQNMVLLDYVILVSLLAGLAGCLSELIPIGKLDDNLTFPILSSFLMWLLFSVINTLSGYPVSI